MSTRFWAKGSAAEATPRYGPPRKLQRLEMGPYMANHRTMAPRSKDPVANASSVSCGPAVWRLGLALVAVLLLLSSCADCFLDIRGRLVECETSTPIAGATITIVIEQGLHDGPLPGNFATDSTGSFKIQSHGSEHCSSWATLAFQKAGFDPLSVQFKGSPKAPAELCMTRSVGN
jgi:hypothetical protein